MADKTKTVIDDMAGRTICATTTEAIATLTRYMTEYVDFPSYELVNVGLGQAEDGSLEFDPAIYTPDMRVMIATVEKRIAKGNSQVMCIVVCPVPSLEAVIADASGKAWLDKIFDTAVNAAAVRELRKPDAKPSDPTILEAMPKTLADYVTSSRGGSSTLLAAFEELWKDVKAVLGDISKSFKLANLSKKEFRRAMESKAHAARFYPLVEETKKGSVFEFAIQAFKAEGSALGYDVSLFDKWMETRATAEISESDDEDEGDFSLDLVSAGLAKRNAADATPAVDATVIAATTTTITDTLDPAPAA